MSTFSAATLSGSTDGRLVKVAATATPGTLIHTGPSVPADYHEIILWAVNSSASPVKLTIEWGGVAVPDDLIEKTIPAESGLFTIVPGLRLKGNATPLVVRAFAATGNVVLIGGYVNTVVA